MNFLKNSITFFSFFSFAANLSFFLKKKKKNSKFFLVAWPPAKIRRDGTQHPFLPPKGSASQLASQFETQLFDSGIPNPFNLKFVLHILQKLVKTFLVTRSELRVCPRTQDKEDVCDQEPLACAESGGAMALPCSCQRNFFKVFF